MPPAGNPFQHWRRIITGLRAEETKLESICFEHAGEAPGAVFGGKGAHSPEREESSSGEADALHHSAHDCRHCGGRSKDPVLNVHHLESRRTGGDSPGNLITLCETCHKALHRGEIKLSIKRGASFRAEAFMGIMRWKVLDRLKAAHPELEVRNTYGYLTKHARIEHGIAKSHCADAFCIAGNLKADRLGSFYYQKQTRRHNRQIHKLSILKGGVRKRNQAPYEVKGFRLFDKVACKGETAFIFGRRSTGSFDVRKLDGTRISAGISFKKLRLHERRRTYLTELRKEAALPPLPEGRGLRADF